MGKAHKAPDPHRPQYRYVSHHALERLRERIVELDLEHRLDADLGRWLDLVIEHAIQENKFEVVIDNGEPTKIVDFTAKFGASGYALVRKNDGRKNGYDEAIVTIIDESTRLRYSKNRWRSAGPMAQQLAKLAPGSVVVREEKPARKEKPVVKPAEPDKDVQYIITYETIAEDPREEMVSFENARKRIAELAADDGVDRSTIRLFREVPITIRIDVEVGS